MKQIEGFENVQASGDFNRLPEGGYVVKITNAIDHADKEYLELFYDIAEGEYRGYYEDDFYADKPYAHHAFSSYKEKALGVFKGTTNAFEASNSGYKWDWNENGLIGKNVGLILKTELYTKNDGSDGERLVAHRFVDAEKIRKGDFKVPEPVDNRTNVGQGSSNDGFMAVPEGADELPFN